MTNVPENLILKQVEVGSMGNFSYFIGDAETKKVAIVDPAWDVDYLCAKAEKDQLVISSILLTHGHPDHVNGLDDLLSRYDVLPVFISKHEPPFYMPRHENVHETDNGQIIKIGNIDIECILTPGHTPGSQCFKHKNILITGDALFIDGCGRCDLPGGDAKEMYNTLYNIIMKLPDDTVIYSGHNYGPTPIATLESQKETNPYLQCTNLEEFLQERMGLTI